MARSTATLYEELTENIRLAQYREATESYCRLIKEGEPTSHAVHAAVSAAAPFVQVPSHVMKRANGEQRGVNYDHTILGWRSAIKLTPYLDDKRALLPTAQAMWYVPQGLNIWEQILCTFPGHYARDAEKCGDRDPDRPEDGHNRFDGPAWSPPKIYFQEHDPILTSSVDEGIDRLQWAIAEGDRAESYGLFLGLAQNPAHRARLKEAITYAGIIDLQDTIINRGGYQNIGHKALRARAMVDIADYLGWENAREVFYTVVPDLGCSPRLYGLWNEISGLVKAEFRDSWATLKRTNQTPLIEEEIDEVVDTILWGGPYEVNNLITTLLRRGRALLAITDALVIAHQRYLVDVLDHPSAFINPMHAMDYANVVNSWIRCYDNPHQAKAVYLEARFFNDAYRFNAMFPRDPRAELPKPAAFAPYAAQIATDRLLCALDDAIADQHAPRALAVLDEYLKRTSDRDDLISTIVLAAARFQNDPHILRNCISSIEEYHANRTSRRDDIFRGWVKVQARYIKRSLADDCYDVYAGHFLL